MSNHSALSLPSVIPLISSVSLSRISLSTVSPFPKCAFPFTLCCFCWNGYLIFSGYFTNHSIIRFRTYYLVKAIQLARILFYSGSKKGIHKLSLEEEEDQQERSYGNDGPSGEHRPIDSGFRSCKNGKSYR